MKKIILAFSTALLLSSSLKVLALGDPLIEKKKTVSKSYPLASGDRISLDNQFGEMKISTWDKSEVKVDITIIGKSSTDERAQEILDRISIEDGKNSDGVYFRTKMNQSGNEGKKGNKNYKEEGMEINYMVYMPASSPLNATNQFGPMIVPDLKGAVDLTSKFGSLTAGKLSNVKELDVEFGKADIEWINNGKVTVKFSKASLGKLSGDLEAHFEFCDVVNIKLDNSVKQLNLKASYSTVEIELTKEISASFDIKTSFGDLNNKTAFGFKEEGDDDDRRGPKFDKQYYGTAGAGAAKIKIKSDFGKVKLM
jgi:hypothetical protein